MGTIMEHESPIEEMLETLPPDRRAEVEKKAAELARDKNFRRAAELMKGSRELEDSRFVSELGWLTAISFGIAAVVL